MMVTIFKKIVIDCRNSISIDFIINIHSARLFRVLYNEKSIPIRNLPIQVLGSVDIIFWAFLADWVCQGRGEG